MSDLARTDTAVVEADPEPTGQPESGGEQQPTSLRRDAWLDLRRNPLFVGAALIIAVLVVVAVAPGLFTSVDPRSCHLEMSKQPPSAEAWFGYDVQGCDVYSRTVYGARASMVVALLAVLTTLLIGGVLGLVAGFYRGWVDTLVSRSTEIVLGLPLLLGATVILATFTNERQGEFGSILKVVAVLGLLGWPTIARVMRSLAIQVGQFDYITAARALGASDWRVILRHLLPNALAPVLVVATIDLGGYITTEATLSFLGIGLQPPAISWGIAISDAQSYLRTAPHMVLFPGLFLSTTVLAFIMLGDAVRNALDPTGR